MWVLAVKLTCDQAISWGKSPLSKGANPAHAFPHPHKPQAIPCLEALPATSATDMVSAPSEDRISAAEVRQRAAFEIGVGD